MFSYLDQISSQNIYYKDEIQVTKFEFSIIVDSSLLMENRETVLQKYTIKKMRMGIYMTPFQIVGVVCKGLGISPKAL